MMVSKFKTSLLIFLLIMLLQTSMSCASTSPETKESVTLQLMWYDQFQFAGYYAALWNGYYADEGFEVTIKSAFDEKGEIKDVIKEVESGSATFGIGTVDTLIAYDEGRDVSLVASFFQRSAVEYYFRPETSIRSLVDLKKMKLLRRQGDLLDIELQTMMASEGIQVANGPFQPANMDIKLEHLTTGTFDMIPGYLGIMPYYAEQYGQHLKAIRPIDYGIDFYGDSLFTRRSLSESNPLLVERFKRASIKGWQYALEHPVEMSQKIASHFKTNGSSYDERLNFNLNQSRRVIELAYFPIVQVGNINPYRWQKIENTLTDLHLIQNAKGTEAFIFDFNAIQQRKFEAFQKMLYIGLAAFASILLLVYVTQLRIKNQMLLRSSERYQSIFNNVAMGITVTDNDSIIVQANDKWCEMTGYNINEMIGKSIYDFIAPSERDLALQENLTGILDDGCVTERLYQKKNGDTFWSRLYYTIVQDEKSKQKLNLGMVIDIDQEKYEEEALKRTEDRFREIIRHVSEEVQESSIESEKLPLVAKIERINLELEKMFKHEVDENHRKEALLVHQTRQAAMGEMVANIAHQWRQPLNTLGLIITNLEEAYQFGELDDTYLHETTVKSRKLIQRMSDTITDFRNFLSPSHQMADFSIYNTAKTVTDMLEETLRFHRIQMHLTGDPEIKTFGHANQLSQAIFSIVGNAIDALSNKQDDDRQIWIDTHLIQEKNNTSPSDIYQEIHHTICLSIRDNGGGIDPLHLDKVFDAYFTTKNTAKGTGLGLYITKVIVENSMKGSIELINIPNGLEARLMLPTKSNHQQITSRINHQGGL